MLNPIAPSPLPLLAFSGSLPAAALLVVVFGAGSIVSEVVVDTCLQRELDPAVFARAYGAFIAVARRGEVRSAGLVTVAAEQA